MDVSYYPHSINFRSSNLQSNYLHLSNLPSNLNQTSHIKFSPGFSLIELMIVIVIISILSFVAVPTYRDYVVRTKVANMLMMAEPMKLKAAEYIMSGGAHNAEKVENMGYAASIEILANNNIEVIGRGEKLGLKSGENNNDLKMTLSPDTRSDWITWGCKAEPADYAKYLPEECRSQAGD